MVGSMKNTPGLSEDLLRYECTLSLEGGAKLATTLVRREVHHCWALRAMVDGKRTTTATRVVGTSRADLALAMKQATAALERRWKGDEIKPKKAFATFAELAKAYATGIKLRAEIADDTIKRTVSSVRLILRASAKDMSASSGVADGDAGGDLVRRFQAVRLAEVAADADDEDRGRARRSIDGALNKARSMFTPAAMEIYRAAKLMVPDLAQFRSVPMLGGHNDCSFVPLPAATLEAMTRSAWNYNCPTYDGNSTDQIDVFSAYLLMRRCGLRNGDAALARLDWLCDELVYVAGFAEPQTVTFIRYKAGKNGRKVRTPMAADVAAALRRNASPDGFLINSTDRSDTVFRKLSEWVRHFVPDREKSSYELRKHFGAVVASCYGLDKASEYLGDLRQTVESHYHAWLDHDRADVARGEDVVPCVVARHLHEQARR